MITPKEYLPEDFLSGSDKSRYLSAIKAEALKGSELIDNLLLLEFCTQEEVQRVLRDVYGIPFAWLNMDMTPPEYREIADRHHILIRKGRALVVYIPLGQVVDDALLQVDIPNYEINVQFIADCNYKSLRSALPLDLISMQVAPFRPLLVFRRLIIDCIEIGGTDVHFQSTFVNKVATHRILNRVRKRLDPSRFMIDFDMMQKIIQAVIGKLSSASTADIDSDRGVTTDVRALFGDGSCDLRITSRRCEAGYYSVFTVQTVNTTNMTIDELGFPASDIELIRDIATRRTGLTLVTGEMRSGKNTTIFAMLNEIIKEPIRIMEFSNPIENHMDIIQFNYRGDLDLLQHMMKTVKKQDCDIAILNEIPNSDVAFAVRDLVNSAICVITTTHINRVWNLPNKLREFFGQDYKTIISELNAVINQKMFLKRPTLQGLQKRALVKEQGPFELYCYRYGVRQYFVPADAPKEQHSFKLQPLTEILVFTDSMKTAVYNFDEIWKGEQMIRSQITQQNGRLETKVAQYINDGWMPLEEMRKLYVDGAD